MLWVKCALWSIRVSESESCSVVYDSLWPPWTIPGILHGSRGILQARILEWVAFPFSRGSSQPRDLTQVSHIAGRFFTSWVTGKPKNTGVGSRSLLQRIFPIQGSNPGLLHFLLHCRQILYPLSHKGSPRILEWVAYPYFSGSSQPRNRTRVSCIAGKFFTNWAIRVTFTFHFHALEKKMATHSRVLAWRIPGTGEPDGLPSMGSHRVGHDWSDLAAAAAVYQIWEW